jgi:hypothetical protein
MASATYGFIGDASIEHSKLAPASEDVNENATLGTTTPLDDPLDMVVSGGTISTPDLNLVRRVMFPAPYKPALPLEKVESVALSSWLKPEPVSVQAETVPP